LAIATATNDEPRINDRIRAREVRLVGPDGAQIGITPLSQALDMARELELDLVEVADKANPPVCRIMDYGKYKYEAAQRAKESRKKSTNVVVKEMKYRPKIGAGDFGTKTKKVAEFLGEGHKVKITIMFRGREMQHPELGRKILDQVAETVTEVGKVEIYPRLDGRNMTMVLGPDKKAQAAADKKRTAPDSTAAAAEAPVADDSASEAPVSEAPTAEAPTAEAPTAEAPTAEAPLEPTDITEASPEA
jgi:translation initiation factor IF-3